MEFVLAKHVAVALHMHNAACAVRPERRYLVGFTAVLIDPAKLLPTAWIRFVRGDEMEPIRIRADRMPQCFDVAAQDEVERLNLLGVGLPRIES